MESNLQNLFRFFQMLKKDIKMETLPIRAFFFSGVLYLYFIHVAITFPGISNKAQRLYVISILYIS